MKLIESQTYINLAKAFAGECQAYLRYKFIEYGARMKGFESIAQIIDEIIYNEFNHARMFYTFLQKAETKQIDNIDICAGFPFKEKWDLEENLRLAAEDEEREEKEVYPEFAKVAKSEGFDEIASLYQMIIQVEEKHKEIFNNLYTQMKNGSLYKKSKAIVWKCPDCGYEYTSKEALDQCPLCLAKQGRMAIKIDL